MRTIAIRVATVGLGLTAGAALAAEPAESSVELQEVVVTARRLTPSASSSWMCFWTAAASRPVQPAMTSCLISTGDSGAPAPSINGNVRRDTGSPRSGSEQSMHVIFH